MVPSPDFAASLISLRQQTTALQLPTSTRKVPCIVSGMMPFQSMKTDAEQGLARQEPQAFSNSSKQSRV